MAAAGMATGPSSAPRRDPASAGVFKVVVGFAIGVFVAALVIPSHSTVTVGSGTGHDSAGGSSVSSGSGPAGQEGSGGGSGGLSQAANAGGLPGGASAGGSPVAGGGSDAGSNSASPGAASRLTSRGVSAATINIGIAYLNLNGVQYLGPDYDVGSVPKQWQAMIAAWHRRGVLPIAGRDVHLTFHNYSVLNASEQRSACAAMIQDDHVFAVVAPEYFYQQGAACVAAENHTPVITSDGPTNEVYQQAAPNLYTIMLSATDQLTNLVYWARDRGLLAGHKIGVYYANDPATQQLVDEGLKAPLERVGSKITAEATTGEANGGPEDAVAVQRFRSAGVNLVVLMTSDLGFLQQADAQGYHPQYMGSDFNGYTTYLNSENFPPDQFDGSPAVTVTDRGVLTTGAPISASARQCLDDYNSYTGEHMAPPAPRGHETAAYVYVMLACDEGQLLLRGLESAGRDLTVASFEGGLTAIHDLPMDYFPNVTFGPGHYEGVAQERTIAWKASCKCWVASGPTQPLSMP